MSNCQDNCQNGSCNSNCSLNKAFSKYFDIPDVNDIKKIIKRDEKGQRLCIDDNCTKHANYGFNGEIASYCSKHKKDDMINKRLYTIKIIKKKEENSNGKLLCSDKTCTRIAHYGYTYGKPEKCKKHKGDCKYQFDICMCGKSTPSYNKPLKKKPMYCKKCKTDNMINLKRKRCKIKKCIHKPYFNYPNETDGIFCIYHKRARMINIIENRCEEIGCKNDAYYNYPNEKYVKYCDEHKKETMIIINKFNKLCEEPHCINKSRVFDFPGGNGLYCKKHKKNGMINIKLKKCQCEKGVAYYNIETEKQPKYCKLCKTDTMVNVTIKICPGAEGTCRTPAKKQYKGYCKHCFRNMFPNDPLVFTIGTKSKELKVRDFINSNFEGFLHDKPLYTGHCDCSVRRRIDHRKLIGNTLLVIETDENQHKSYKKMDEETRYNDLYMAFSGKWIYIRFNPDKFLSKKGGRRNPPLEIRLERLKKEILKQINRINNEENTELIERVYMYYDECENEEL